MGSMNKQVLNTNGKTHYKKTEDIFDRILKGTIGIQAHIN